MKNTKGFTLTEVVVATFITVVAATAATSFLIQMLRSSYESEQKYKLNTVSHSITTDLMEKAALANLIVLYKSSAVADCNAANDRLAIDTVPTPWLRPSGDMAVFIFFESPKPVLSQYHRIKSIFCYYALPRADSGFSFRRMEIDFTKRPPPWNVPLDLPTVAGTPPTLAPDYLEQIITTSWGIGTVKILHDSVRGLSRDEINVADLTPRIFYYNDFRTVTLNMQLFSSGRGNNNANTGSRNTVSSSINFTLTPRT